MADEQKPKPSEPPRPQPPRGLPVEHGVVNPNGNWQDNTSDPRRGSGKTPMPPKSEDTSANR